MSQTNPITQFYSNMGNSGATVEVRHRYFAGVNRFLFVVQVSSEAAAKQVVESAKLLLKCPDPQHRRSTKDGIWRAYGLYRPLLQVPTEVKELDEVAA